ncbi:MAG: family 20 glycosylhydrolase [Abditibacteriales bacterium]|nr:family 20 glycosylhydrolase [Abditibacteriales bacterium]MDW8367603.1 glycoside hydrolase family 20 zincin-like fold domain-containing protein [Abditibacteriales bacterium]
MKCLVTWLCLVCLTSPVRAQTNLIENPGFETARDDAAENWTIEVHTQQGARGSVALDATEKASGKTSLRITNDSPQPAWVRASQEPIAARRHHLYRFACRVKSTAPYLVLVYEFRKGTTAYVTHKVAEGTASDWTTVSGTFRTGADARHFKVSLITTAQGVAWFDDVTLIDVSEPPDLIAPKTTAPPTLDGKLDDAVWQSAATAQPFYLLGGGGAFVKEQTTVYAAYDDQHLYLAFVCFESKPAALKRTRTRDGEPVFLDDAVEVFVDPQHNHQTYHHLVVNANGTRYTARTSARGLNTDWRGNNPFGVSELRWTAKASVGNDRWVVELALPLAELAAPPRAGTVWGINFTRDRRTEGEEFSTWAYLEGKTFHAPQQFGHLIFAADPTSAVRNMQTLSSPVGTEGKSPHRFGTPIVIPQPQRVEWTSQRFVISSETTIVPPRNPKPLEAFAVQVLQDDIKARTGKTLRLTTTPPRRGTCIVFESPSLSSPLPPEGYRLNVSEKRVTLMGADERGTLYGVQTLRQVLQTVSGKLVLPGVRIEDYPDQRIRAWHLIAPRRGDGEKFKRLVEVFALLKYNTLMIEVDGWLQYERHPKVAAPDAMSKAEMKSLVEYAKQRGFEVIPQVQTFGHFDYVLRQEAYRHLAENPNAVHRREAPRPAYCPSHPDTYKLVFDLFEEVIEVFQPRSFHIGHDEITEYGRGDLALCERCQGTPPHELFANEVIKLHGWLKERGLTTLMWGDQLLAEHNGGPPFNTALATPLLPKDIIICDWRYAPRADHPSLRYFTQHGFKVIACGWYNLYALFRFSELAREHGVEGYSGTSWWNTRDIADTPEMMSAIVLTAENAWSTQKPPLEQVPYHPTQEFRRLFQLPVTSEQLSVTGHHVSRLTFHVLDLSAHANARLETIEPNLTQIETLPDRAFGDLPSGVQWLRGIPFAVINPLQHRGFAGIGLANDEDPPTALPSRVYQIPVGAQVKSLFFLHTTSKPRHTAETMYDRAAADPQRIGEYVITYADGTRERVPLLYRKNIVDWNDRLGGSRADIAWLGRTASGALLLLSVWEWQNPHPEKVIHTIDIVSAHTEVRPVVLAVTGVS